MQSPVMAPSWFSSPPQAYSNPFSAYTPVVRSPLSRAEPAPERASFNFGTHGSHSSPLTERHSMSTFSLSEPQSAERVIRPAWSQRAIRRAPVASSDALKEKRRKIFLNKVKDSREEGRFDKMSEDIMRLDFVREQKQWEAEQAQSAPIETMEESDEDMSGANGDTHIQQPSLDLSMYINAGPGFSNPTSSPEAEAELIAMHEQEELDALLDFLPESNAPQSTEHKHISDEVMSEHFGSDDEGFDDMFDDFVLDDPTFMNTQTFPASTMVPENQSGNRVGDVDMDMS